jgi:hypothetical protein
MGASRGIILPDELEVVQSVHSCFDFQYGSVV